MIILLFVPAVSAVVQLTISPGPEIAPNTEVTVNWTQTKSDPSVWNLRSKNVVSGTDVEVKTVHAEGNVTGNVTMTFPQAGQFILDAVDPANNSTLAYTGWLQVGNISILSSSLSSTSSDSSSYSTSTNTTFTPDITISTLSSGSATTIPSQTSSKTSSSTVPSSASSTTSRQPLSVSPSSPSASSHPTSSKTPAIFGGVVGGVVFLSIVAIIAVIFQRRRQRAARRITFDRDLMVQRRDALPQTHYDVERDAMPMAA